MAIAPKCDKCGQELTKFGAILFSPPNQNSEVKKFHICQDCYYKMVQDFGANGLSDSPEEPKG